MFSLSIHKSSCCSLLSFICSSCFASTDWPYPPAVTNVQHIRKQWGRWACSQEPCYGSCEWGLHQQGAEMQKGKSLSGSGTETVIRLAENLPREMQGRPSPLAFSTTVLTREVADLGLRQLNWTQPTKLLECGCVLDSTFWGSDARRERFSHLHLKQEAFW